MPYKALARASVNIEIIEDIEQYEALIISTNGVILQPYDTSTTLIGTVLKNKVDITNRIEDVRWTKWNPSNDNLIECEEWNENHIGMSTIILTKEDVDGKSVFVFEARDKNGRLLCSSSISIVDINDLLASTNKPENPYVGQIWIDGSTDPATMYVWNGYKWVVTGSVGAIVKNLLRNTSFIGLDYWNIVGDTTLSFTPYSVEHLGHNFLKLNSDVLTDEDRGISQSTTDIICPFGEYSFQMLFYSTNETETYSNNIMVNIYSVGKHTGEVLVYNKMLEAERRILRVLGVFEAMSDTDHFRVEILGESGSRYEFYIAELALYNTHNNYPWTINPLDIVAREYTQEDIWNILSNNGTIQGIFSRKDPETGQLEYYINASMIQAGKMKAEFMEMYGLKVLRKSDKKATLEITDNGDVLLNVNKLVITSGDTEMNVEQEISAEGMKSKVEDIITDEDGEVNKHIVSIAQQAAGGFSQEVLDQITGSMSSFSQTLEDITTRVENAEGDLSEVEQTADKIGWLIKSGESESSMELTDKLYSLTTEKAMISAKEIELNGSININNGTFTVDTEGNMTANSGKFQGEISASHVSGSTIEGTKITGGTIIATDIYSQEVYDENGNWLLDKNGDPVVPKFSLTSDGTLTSYNAKVYGEVAGNIMTGSEFRSANGKFIVTAAGQLTCEDASIKGTLEAGSSINSPSINGGTITGSIIQNESKSFTVDADGHVTGATINGGEVIGATIKGGSIGIGNGDQYNAFTVDQNGNCNIGNGKFTVSNKGVLYAEAGTFKGTMESGSIVGGEIKIGDDATGDYFFKVTSDGTLYARKAIIDTEMNATTGYIAGFLIDNNKLTATNVGLSSSNATNAIAFWAGSDTASTAPFNVTNSGKLTASNVYITGGVLNINNKFTVDNQGVMIAEEGFFRGTMDAGEIKGVTITATENINVNDKFKVDKSGNLTATNADITGTISSKQGDIGNFKINTDTITGTKVGLGSSTAGTMAFWAGSNTANSAPFRVNHDGQLTATDANITGTISADDGDIGGFSIGEYKLTGTKVGMCSNGDVEWAFWAGAKYGVDAPFHVGHDGTLYATKATLSGTIEGGTIKIGPVTNTDGSTVYNFTVNSEGDMKLGWDTETQEYKFFASRNGNLEIGGAGRQKIGDYTRSALEITPNGNLFSVSSTAGLYTQLSAGKLACYGPTDSEGNRDSYTMIEYGAIDAINASIECKSLAADTEISTDTLIVDHINNKAYPKTITSGATLHIGAWKKSDTETIQPNDDDDYKDDAVYSSIATALSKIPKNLNGKTVRIQLEKNITEDVTFNSYSTGNLHLCFNGKTLYGYVFVKNCSASVYVVGGSDSDIDASTGIIRPQGEGVTCASRTCSLGVERCAYVSFQSMKLYGAKSAVSGISDTEIVGVGAQGASNIYMKGVQIVNTAVGVRSASMSQVHSYESSGTATDTGWYATSGGKVSLAGHKQTGGKKNNTAKDEAGQIWTDSTTSYDGTQTTDTSTPTVPEKVTKTVTYKADYADTYRHSVYNTWKKDGTARQGDWGYGDCAGYWFFGDDFANIRSKNVTQIDITITRQNSNNGNNSAVEHKLVTHTYKSRPSGAPSTSGTTIGTLSLTRGQTKTLTITNSSIITAIKNGRGFAIRHSYDRSHYSVCSGSAKIKFTYKE